MLNYTKLWLLLEKRGLQKTDLTKQKIISSVTLAKLGKNETISSDTIEKICSFLNCQPGDIMEYISEEQIQMATKQLDNLNKALAKQLQEHGVTEEQYASMMSQLIPEMVKSMYQGGKSTNQLMDEIIETNLEKSE